ncbi:MAG: hypothetical protein HYT97_00530 [Elusimicrobia bacterium]|nr:hypothetical protein [Elusimicrobiota bacterium]
MEAGRSGSNHWLGSKSTGKESSTSGWQSQISHFATGSSKELGKRSSIQSDKEECEKYFDIPDAQKHYPARFMLYVAPVKKKQQSHLPAITHADVTGRLQTVFKETNPRSHRLIQKFGEATGIPVLLNTSFNLKGEPIVNTPQNAYNTIMNSGMDALVLNNSIITK